MKKEPVVTVATVTALVGAAVALVVAFGAPLTEEQQNAILGLTTVVAPLVVIVARRYVTPVVRDAQPPISE